MSYWYLIWSETQNLQTRLWTKICSGCRKTNINCCKYTDNNIILLIIAYVFACVVSKLIISRGGSKLSVLLTVFSAELVKLLNTLIIIFKLKRSSVYDFGPWGNDYDFGIVKKFNENWTQIFAGSLVIMTMINDFEFFYKTEMSLTYKNRKYSRYKFERVIFVFFVIFFMM